MTRRPCLILSAVSSRAVRGTRPRAFWTRPETSSASSRTHRTGSAPAAGPTGRETDMTAQAQETPTVVYIYGILPGDVEVQPDVPGVGTPPGEVRIVRHRDLAALVSDIDPGLPLGQPEDLIAHEELLDATAAGVPVLPLRFGAVVASDDAVAEELLGAHYDDFSEALRQLEGHAQYVVKGRYVEDAVLREVLTENPEAARLGDQIRGADENATRELRMQLGELISV